MNIKNIVQSALKASLENLDGSEGTPAVIPDAIPVEAHTPELVEESNESIDEAVHAHSVIEEHHAKLDALEHVVEEMQEVVQALESADGLGVVSQENAEGSEVNSDDAQTVTDATPSTDETAAVAQAAEGANGVEVITAGETGTVDSTVVTPTDAGVIVDPAVVEPNPDLSIVSLERYNANLRRLGSIYNAVGMESLPATTTPAQKPGVIAGAKARIAAVIAAMKRVWDALVAHVKTFFEHATNSTIATKKRAMALAAKAKTMTSHTADKKVKVIAFTTCKKSLQSLLMMAKDVAGHETSSHADAMAPMQDLPPNAFVGTEQNPWTIAEIEEGANEVVKLTEVLLAAKERISKEGADLDQKLSAAIAKAELTDVLKKEYKDGRAQLQRGTKLISEILKNAKFTLNSAEKSLRAYKAPAAAAATA